MSTDYSRGFRSKWGEIIVLRSRAFRSHCQGSSCLFVEFPFVALHGRVTWPRTWQAIDSKKKHLREFKFQGTAITAKACTWLCQCLVRGALSRTLLIWKKSLIISCLFSSFTISFPATWLLKDFSLVTEVLKEHWLWAISTFLTPCSFWLSRNWNLLYCCTHC